MIGFSNGVYVPTPEITFPVDSLAVNRGYGAYEFFGVHHRKPFYMDRHLERLANSLKILRLKTNYFPAIEQVVASLIQQNPLPDFYIKLFVLPIHAANPQEMEGNLYIFPVVFPPFSNDEFEKGLPLISRNFTRFLPEAKSTAYLAGQYWQHEITQAGALDVLFHTDGTVTETSRGNIFMVKNEKVFTPHVGMLKGITRSVVIDLIHLNGVEFEEKTISLEELLLADEVIVTSTTKEVMPIIKIDNRNIGTGQPGLFSKWMAQEFLIHKQNYCR